MVSVLAINSERRNAIHLLVLFAPAGTGQAKALIAVRKSGPYLTRPGEYDAVSRQHAKPTPARKGLGSAGGRFAYRDEDTGRPQSLAPRKVGAKYFRNL